MHRGANTGPEESLQDLGHVASRHPRKSNAKLPYWHSGRPSRLW